MSQYTALTQWTRHDNEAFTDNQYSRRHDATFDSGIILPMSSSPHVVPLPYSDASAVDPEELFVASLSSCHMLWFLGIAAKKRFCVDNYHDHAVGVMAENAQGKLAMTAVTLRPKVTFSGERLPTREQIEQMHHLAHESCFIANSVTTDLRCEPVW
ncbi:peroxiredoxin [Formosimonas limnophila]|uniref:Peroxiredoxin n=1 Tax=Formosimonas limnophila TaxID=1384487 RepID=A0A8J3G056_9BURK|nr:OsmC family protein [Formosimonas limnophila]GHA75090.1 peroxiredoxin [Formosimonas limnophila]